jgi:apolipoprotein N-acyltransferase
LVDYLKTIGYLAFPWGILGYSQYRNLHLIQSARLFGVWGIDFVLLFSNVTIASALVEFRDTGTFKASRANLILLACAVLLLLLFGVRELEVEKKQELRKARIALIQGNLDPWSPQITENIQVEMELTRMAMEQDPDLVVWSESSVPFPFEYYLTRGEQHALRIQAFAKSLGIPLLFGSIEFDGTVENGEYIGDFYNVAILYREGRLTDVYRKIHLVPFGEWFPYGRLFPFVSLILEKAGAGDFTPGTEYVVFDMGEFTASVLICFEDVFGNLTRMFIPQNTQLFINVTNDAWTGSEKAEVQHFSISVFRTVETRRSLVRAANGGVTVCVNPYGRIIGSLPLFTSDYLVCDVPLQEGNRSTLYVRWGDFFPKGLGVIFIVYVLSIGVKKVIDRKKKKNIM